MTNRPVVIFLERFGSQCPTQWDGKTEDGRDIYIRYRWGRLRAGFQTTEWWDWIYDELIGGEYDGYMTTEAMIEHTRDALDWSKMADVNE